MNVLVYDAKRDDRESLTVANQGRHDFTFVEAQLNDETVPLAQAFAAISIFVNDDASASVLRALAERGTKLVAVRGTGFNNVDLASATALDMTVMRVAHYSPHAVAEHAVALLMAVNRKIYRAYNRTRENNFTLDGLQGMDVHGKTVGVIGTGRIGVILISTSRGKLIDTEALIDALKCGQH